LLFGVAAHAIGLRFNHRRRRRRNTDTDAIAEIDDVF
jgi:hypothetical protein